MVIMVVGSGSDGDDGDVKYTIEKMLTTLFSSDCLPHPKITNYTRAAATAFPGEPFETGETETKRYFLFDQQMLRIFSL